MKKLLRKLRQRAALNERLFLKLYEAARELHDAVDDLPPGKGTTALHFRTLDLRRVLRKCHRLLNIKGEFGW